MEDFVKKKFLQHPKAKEKNSCLISFPSCTAFQLQKCFCLVYQWRTIFLPLIKLSTHTHPLSSQTVRPLDESPPPAPFSISRYPFSFTLLQFIKGSRPLVLNFGSCNWTPFATYLRTTFSDIVRRFADVADFVVVYIEEAHPTDGCPFKIIMSWLNFVRVRCRCSGAFFRTFLLFFWLVQTKLSTNNYNQVCYEHSEFQVNR